MPRRRKQHGRPIDGIVLLNKPVGITSNKALQAVKELFYARKAGHTGSLDPMATGVLPICFGEATKVSGFLLDADKGYSLTLKLGEQTDTADADGTVVATADWAHLTDADLQAACNAHTGDIEQIPPMYSAVHHNGKRLHELAREGIEVEREARPVTIHSIEIASKSADGQSIDLHVRCTKGTYVRTLAEDIAKHMGTLAHLTRLERTEAGPFLLENTITMDALEALHANGKETEFAELNATLLPVEAAVLDWPAVELDADMTFYMKRGQALTIPNAPESGMLRLLDNENQFFGIGEINEDGMVAPRRLLV